MAAQPFVVALAEPYRIELVEEARPALGPDQVLLRTLHSGISIGTEMAAYRGTNPYLHKRWDPERRLFVAAAEASLTYPVTNWGYEEVGEVLEGPLPSGTLVFGAWGHRSEHVVAAEWAAARMLPAGADPLLGIFSHIGPIALNGVLDSAVRLGETAVVFGLGVVGQLLCQLLRLSGARVIGVDLLESRRLKAQQLGLETALDAATPVAEQVKELTGGRGADVCLEASGSTRALQEAIRCCAYSSRVVAIGFYQGEAAGLRLGEEFHHNRVNLVCSQISGVAPDLQHRWNRERLVSTFMRLAADGSVRCTELITHRVPVAAAPEIYRLIDQQPQDVLLAVLDFG